MSDDSDYEYCDGLFNRSAVCAAIMEGGGDYQIPYDVGFYLLISDWRDVEKFLAVLAWTLAIAVEHCFVYKDDDE